MVVVVHEHHGGTRGQGVHRACCVCILGLCDDEGDELSSVANSICVLRAVRLSQHSVRRVQPQLSVWDVVCVMYVACASVTVRAV